MNEMIIRKPVISEIETIVKIWLDGNLQAHPFIHPDYWLSHVGYIRQALPSAEVYVCEAEEEIAGFVGLEGNYIAGLFVRSWYRSKGIGSYLIDFIKERYSSLTLAVYKKNEKAQRFYLRQNFVM